MEKFKAIDEVIQPDVRQQFWTKVTETGFRKIAFEDYYRAAESITLHEGVPEDIKTHFQTARHLIVYAWFYYRFHSTAELLAYISAEYALRLKAGKPTWGLKRLLTEAVEKKWITDKGFSVVHKRRERAMRLQLEEGAPPPPPEDEEVQRYCNVLVETLPYLRNQLAHGANTLSLNSGVRTLKTCAELINQLFDKK